MAAMKHTLLFLLLLLAAGCSTNQSEKSYFDNFYETYLAIKEQQNPLTWQQGQSLPYASIRTMVNDGTPVLMVLGYLVDNQQKWYSKNRFSFTSENGRVVQVYNVSSEISSIRPSPIWQNLQLASVKLNQVITIPMFIDFLSSKRIDVKASVRIQGDGYEERQLFGKSVRLFRVSEQLTIPSMNFSYTNYYWKDVSTGFIWESIQKWGPDVPKIHYQVIKPWINTIPEFIAP
ncbi:YjbF family lipoprotein [Thiomicrorhabdus sediminis]|uniref:YjbF family lipoprotein n=1 Tax=Thiomicrorhabdus sediminis TaxID=2580412 RepID=A0A4V1HHM6_9GAMM|nr:YjbF family lipoprotein [Thiomicrorhabdus sediminis]QCU89553.1 YjbF family lipoprotein [Thiomicrorhabdus sediminis]